MDELMNCKEYSRIELVEILLCPVISENDRVAASNELWKRGTGYKEVAQMAEALTNLRNAVDKQGAAEEMRVAAANDYFKAEKEYDKYSKM